MMASPGRRIPLLVRSTPVKHFIALCCLVFVGLAHLYGQAPDTLMINDSLAPAPDTLFSDTKERRGFFKNAFGRHDYPNPTKALAYSLILPGSGQFYNKKYLKVAIVYGGFAAMIGGINWQSDRLDRFETALQLKLKDEPHEFTGTSLDSERALRSQRNQYRKNRELLYIGVGVFYLLNGLDAYVDAHLLQFDVSEDLSLRLQPSVQAGLPGFGLRMQLSPVRPDLPVSP